MCAMIASLRWWLILPVLAAPALRAQGVAEVITALPGSSLTIRGSTTVGARWHCRSTGIESRVAIAPREASVPGGLPQVRGVVVLVPVSALRCQSGPMDRAMRHALRADRDTAARTVIGRFEVPDSIPAPRANEALLVGGLRVAAVERGVFLRALVAPRGNGTIRVTSQIPLTLSGFNIVAPRVLFGAVRARDAISVEVDLLFPVRPHARDELP